MNSMVSPFVNLCVVIRALRGAMGGWGWPGQLSPALLLLLYRRLGQICLKMERLAARFEAGRLWRRTPRPGAGGRDAAVREGDGRKGTQVRGARLWPGGFGWMVRVGSYQAAGYGSQLRAILGQPEMVALLEAAPQAARILRPLCRMLGVETSLLRPGMEVEAAGPRPAADPVVRKRVRKPRPKLDWGRIPIPRGVLSWARREGFGKA